MLRGIADRCDSSLPWAYNFDGYTYSENLGVFVPARRADAIVERLQAAFASSPAGPFQLTAMKPLPIREPFKFLGYWFRVADGVAEVFVPKDIARARMEAILQTLPTAGPADVEKMARVIDGVAGDWRLWSGSQGWRRQALTQLQCAGSAIANSPRRIVEGSVRGHGNA